MIKIKSAKRAAAGSQYALIVGLIAVVALVAITVVGGGVQALLSNVANRLCNGGGACASDGAQIDPGAGQGGATGGGSVYAFGGGKFGRLGNNSTNNVLSPTAVLGPSGGSTTLNNIVAARGASNAACGVASDGGVWCWGGNAEGALGDGDPVGSLQSHLLPVRVVAVGASAGGASLSGMSASITAGYYHVCAVGTDSKVYCWGKNDVGQLGQGANTSNACNCITSPVTVLDTTGVGGSTLSGMTQVVSGWYTNCALGTHNGTTNGVWCWGWATYGQLGNNTTTPHAQYPVQVYNAGVSNGSSFLSGIQQIAGDGDHICALTSSGGVACWGSGAEDIGTNTGGAVAAYPRTVSGLTGVVKIGAAENNSCAIKSDGSLWCWGRGAEGELGNNGTAASYTPVQVQTSASPVTYLTGVTSVAGSYSNVCAVASGNLYCWGLNASGEDGIGSTTPSTLKLATQAGSDTGYSGVYATQGNGQGYILAIK